MKLWLDDQINDTNCPARHVPEGFVGASNINEAKQLVLLHGMPSFIDFDHDLGNDEDAIQLIKWLIEKNLSGNIQGPVPKYNVHSANPVGRLNIVSMMLTWHKVLTLK
jgi:hypothetical protein